MHLYFSLQKQLKSEDQSRVSMLLWSLWRKRNKKVWDNKLLSESKVIQQAGDMFYQDWMSAKDLSVTRGHEQHNHYRVQWVPPPTGALKCNLDASFFIYM